jgi:hypothetical protein
MYHRLEWLRNSLGKSGASWRMKVQKDIIQRRASSSRVFFERIFQRFMSEFRKYIKQRWDFDDSQGICRIWSCEFWFDLVDKSSESLVGCKQRMARCILQELDDCCRGVTWGHRVRLNSYQRSGMIQITRNTYNKSCPSNAQRHRLVKEWIGKGDKCHNFTVWSGPPWPNIMGNSVCCSSEFEERDLRRLWMAILWKDICSLICVMLPMKVDDLRKSDRAVGGGIDTVRSVDWHRGRVDGVDIDFQAFGLYTRACAGLLQRCTWNPEKDHLPCETEFRLSGYVDKTKLLIGFYMGYVPLNNSRAVCGETIVKFGDVWRAVRNCLGWSFHSFCWIYSRIDSQKKDFETAKANEDTVMQWRSRNLK